MSTRYHEGNWCTPSHRQALLSAMRIYLTAPFFLPWRDWIDGLGGTEPGGGLCLTSTSRPC